MVVLEYTTEEGTTIRVHDDAYRDKTPEEMEAAKEHVNDVVNQCLWNEAKRRAEKAMDTA